MSTETAIIFMGGTPRQNTYFWPSYGELAAGTNHDLILVHRNMLGVPDVNYIRNMVGPYGNLILEDKCFPEGELPHKAFGGYRHFFNKYKDKYKYFAFISDDVLLRRNNWLKDAIQPLTRYEKCGFTSPMLHNVPTHIRAPIWFGKSECLSKVAWEFSDDHDGEMRIADQCVSAGYFGVQVGHKITLAYDPDNNCKRAFEVENFGESHLDSFFTEDEINKFEMTFLKKLSYSDVGERLKSFYIPYYTVLELQPFDRLIYNPSKHIVIKEEIEFSTIRFPIDNDTYPNKTVEINILDL